MLACCVGTGGEKVASGELGSLMQVVGESGIFTPEHLARAQQAGCGAVLVGESLVKQTDAATGIRKLYSME